MPSISTYSDAELQKIAGQSNDLTGYSDDELKSIVGQNDLSGVSDEELMRMVGEVPNVAQRGAQPPISGDMAQFADAYAQPESIMSVPGEDISQGQELGVPNVPRGTPDASYGEVLLGAPVKSVIPSYKQAAGGLLQEYGETPDIIKPPEKVMELAGSFFESDKKRKAKIAELGKSLYERATQELQDIQPKVEPGSAKYYAGGAAQSVANMLPALTAGLFGGAPATLGVIGLQVKGQSYGDQRAKGSDIATAKLASTAYALAEAIPEALPVSILLKPGATFLKKAGKFIVAEEMQELLTEILQIGIENKTITPDMTWGEARARLKDVAIMTPLSAGALATITHPFVKGQGSSETPPPDIQPPFTPTPDFAPEPQTPVEVVTPEVVEKVKEETSKIEDISNQELEKIAEKPKVEKEAVKIEDISDSELAKVARVELEVVSPKD